MYQHVEYEEWLQIEGEPDTWISNYGRVWSQRLKRFIEPHLHPTTNGKGYYLRVKINGAKYLVHRLTCRAFNGPAPEGKNIVDHRNGNKMDPSAWNVRWVSSSVNRICAVILNRPRMLIKYKTEEGCIYSLSNG